VAPLTSIVIGYPTETEDSIRATIRWCVEAGVYPSTGYLLPQPRTPMYEHACRNGFIPDEEAYLLAMGDRQDLRLNMTQIPDDRLEAVVAAELRRASSELSINLAGHGLLKTGAYRAARPNPVTSL
jgi:hypothetical protein